MPTYSLFPHPERGDDTKSRTVRVSRSALQLRIPTLPRSYSLSNMKVKFEEAHRPCQCTKKLPSVHEVEVESEEPSPPLRPCQETYFEHGIPTARKDKDADIFSKHLANAAAHPRPGSSSSSSYSDEEANEGKEHGVPNEGGEPGEDRKHGELGEHDDGGEHDESGEHEDDPPSPIVVVVDRDAPVSEPSDDEDSEDDIREIDEDFDDFKNWKPDQNSPTRVLLNAVQRHVEVTQPARYPPRSSSLANKEKPVVRESKPEIESRKDSSVHFQLPIPETEPPPIPPRSKLRLLRDAHSTATGLTSADNPAIAATAIPEAKDTTKDGSTCSTIRSQSNVLATVRSRLSTLKMPAMRFSRNSQPNRQSKTPEEIDFLNGKTSLYICIQGARQERRRQEESHWEGVVEQGIQRKGDQPEHGVRPLQWLKFNEDLAADARVTADGEDFEASISPPAEKKEKQLLTRIEVVETTGHVILIGPAGYGALTLGESWAGGHNKRHLYNCHQNMTFPQHDECCSCKLYQAWSLITDESYKYLGVARSAREGRWVVHLAKQMPIWTEEARALELAKTTPPPPRFTIMRKPVPRKTFPAARVGFI
ncbi:hypothetical protein PRZ48_005092 [Zasmidium cellare]|uniref:Uncharacterized protein n=1 Tax=Zasmidium cellare TaxID=395010 RepID=A0ABR0ESI7_ZASCE|nr:hypothetical protein PRZ48_005092 [Zasmidium cellare]